MAAELTDDVLAALNELGIDVLNRPSRLREFLLARTTADGRRVAAEINGLCEAARLGIAAEAARVDAPIDPDPFVRRLVDEVGLHEELARVTYRALRVAGKLANEQPVARPEPVPEWTPPTLIAPPVWGSPSPAAPIARPALPIALPDQPTIVRPPAAQPGIGEPSGRPPRGGRVPTGLLLAAAGLVAAVVIGAVVLTRGGDDADTVGTRGDTEASAPSDSDGADTAAGPPPVAEQPTTTGLAPEPTVAPVPETPVATVPTTPVPIVDPEDARLGAILAGACVVKADISAPLTEVACDDPTATGRVITASVSPNIGECPVEARTTYTITTTSGTTFQFCVERLLGGYTVAEFFAVPPGCSEVTPDHPSAGELASTECPPAPDGFSIVLTKLDRRENEYVAALREVGVQLERIGDFTTDTDSDCGRIWESNTDTTKTLFYTFRSAPFSVRVVGPPGTPSDALDRATKFSFVTC